MKSTITVFSAVLLMLLSFEATAKEASVEVSQKGVTCRVLSNSNYIGKFSIGTKKGFFGKASLKSAAGIWISKEKGAEVYAFARFSSVNPSDVQVYILDQINIIKQGRKVTIDSANILSSNVHNVEQKEFSMTTSPDGKTTVFCDIKG